MKRLTKIILWTFIVTDVIMVLLDMQHLSLAQRGLPEVHTAIFVQLLFILGQLVIYMLFLTPTVRAEKELIVPALLFRVLSITMVIFYSISLFTVMSFKDGMMKEF